VIEKYFDGMKKDLIGFAKSGKGEISFGLLCRRSNVGYNLVEI
jgi:hypothetical protein